MAAAQQAENSASRRRGAATEKRVEPARNEREVSVHHGPPPRGKKRYPSRNASSTIENSTTLDMTSTSTAAADMGTLRSMATAPTAVDIMTAMRTGWLQSHQALESSVEGSTACHCPAHFDPQPASPSTTAKLNQNCGWRTSGWPASWEATEETIGPSSGSYHSSSPTPLVDSSRSSLPTKSTTRLTWSGCSKGTSRGLTSALATRGISKNASRNRENLSESMLVASRSSTPSSRTSPTTTSFWRLSQAPLARIWCES